MKSAYFLVVRPGFELDRQNQNCSATITPSDKAILRLQSYTKNRLCKYYLSGSEPNFIFPASAFRQGLFNILPASESSWHN